MNSLEFIKQHVTEWPSDDRDRISLSNDGFVCFGYELKSGYQSIDLSEHFAPSYYDGKVWTRQEFEACGADVFIDWSNAPDWATSYGIGSHGGLWYSETRYQYLDSVSHDNRDFGFIEHVESRPTPNTESSTGIDATVEERGNRYGAFKDGADIMQELKSVMRSTPNWSSLTPSQREALEMIQHKVGRILNGDPNYTDSWHDIKGYAHLIEEELNGNAK